MDGFARSDPSVTNYAYSQMNPRDLPNYWHWARRFVLADDFFASHRGSSFPNHLYLIAAQAGGATDGPGLTVPKPVPGGPARSWGCDAPEGETVPILDSEGEKIRVPPCFDFLTEGDLLNDAGIDWRYYGSTRVQSGYIWSAYDAVRHIRETDQWVKHVVPSTGSSPTQRPVGCRRSGG